MMQCLATYNVAKGERSRGASVVGADGIFKNEFILVVENLPILYFMEYYLAVGKIFAIYIIECLLAANNIFCIYIYLFIREGMKANLWFRKCPQGGPGWFC